jgi:translation initiation factor IF-1
MSEDKIEKRGTVTKKLPDGRCKVEVHGNGKEVLGILKGNMQRHKIEVLPGDEVQLKFSPYDLSKAYVTYRYD